MAKASSRSSSERSHDTVSGMWPVCCCVTQLEEEACKQLRFERRSERNNKERERSNIAVKREVPLNEYVIEHGRLRQLMVTGKAFLRLENSSWEKKYMIIKTNVEIKNI